MSAAARQPDTAEPMIHLYEPPAGQGGEVSELPERGSAPALLRACRPRQWAKNVLVLAAPCAAGVIDRPSVAARVAAAFVILCALSSATYLVNDVRDVEQDRQHPRKRRRPIAAGELSVRGALAAAATLALGGVAAATAVNVGFGGLALGYLAMTMSYSLWLRRVVVLDILLVAAGFVLRAFAGGVASDIYLSRWFVMVTGCCAVFIVTAKRYAELRERREATQLRATLRRYSPRQLRALMVSAALLASVAYAGWALSRPDHLVWYGFSIAAFVLWLGRYAGLIRAGAGEAPEELILRDRTLLGLSVLWCALFFLGVYVGR